MCPFSFLWHNLTVVLCAPSPLGERAGGEGKKKQTRENNAEEKQTRASGARCCSPRVLEVGEGEAPAGAAEGTRSEQKRTKKQGRPVGALDLPLLFHSGFSATRSEGEAAPPTGATATRRGEREKTVFSVLTSHAFARGQALSLKREQTPSFRWMFSFEVA